MKSLVIGTDKPEYFNSRCMWCGADVSENSIYYILNSYITDTRIYIYKESSEGKSIEEWLSKEENRNNECVQNKALELSLPHLKPEEFLDIIKIKSKNAYEKGYKTAQRDIRNALGINTF